MNKDKLKKRKSAIIKIRDKSKSNHEILMHRTNKYLIAQLIVNNVTVFSLSTITFRQPDKKINLKNRIHSEKLGIEFAKKCLDNKEIKNIPYLNRASYKYGQNLSSFYESFKQHFSI